MLGHKHMKSSKILGVKNQSISQSLGVKLKKSSLSSHPLTTGITNIGQNEHTNQSIYVPLGLNQSKQFESKKYNSLEKFHKRK